VSIPHTAAGRQVLHTLDVPPWTRPLPGRPPHEDVPGVETVDFISRTTSGSPVAVPGESPRRSPFDSAIAVTRTGVVAG